MRFTDAFTNSDNPTNTDPSGFSQKSFQGQIDYIVFTSLINNSSIRDLARITHAGAWLRAVPNENLGLSFSKHEFITSVRIWLGIPIFPSHPNAQRCVCVVTSLISLGTTS